MAKLDVDTMFRAFSDPTRLRIMNTLRSGELCVCDLVDILQLSQQTIARQASLLQRARLLQRREERSWSFYSLVPARSPVHDKLLECLGPCANEMADTPDDERRTQRNRAHGGCCPP